MDIGIQSLLLQEQIIHVSLYKTYLDKPDRFIFHFKKEDWKLFFRPITEQQFVEFTKMLPTDWLRKYV